MVKETIKYQDIDWPNINYSNLTKVKSMCKAVKDYFWANRKNPIQSELILGEARSFLITVFETYSPEWFERIGAHEVNGFVVKEAKGYSTQCLNVVLKDCTLDDSAFSYAKLSKGGRIKNDVKEACRNAIQEIKKDFKDRNCYGVCPVSGLDLSCDNSVVHHYNEYMNKVIEEWVKAQGGYESVYEFVNSTIGGGTNTFFHDNEIAQNFIDYHNRHTHLVVLHQKGHYMVHNLSHCETEKQKELRKRYI